MIESLLIFSLRLNILEENHLEKSGFQKNIDKSRSILYDGNIEEEGGS